MALRWTEEDLQNYLRRREAAKREPSAKGRPEETSLSPAGDISPFRGEGSHPEGAGGKPPAKSKYGNRRTEYDGKKFDSQHEAQVYAELLLLVRAGRLKCVLRQVSFDLPGGIRYVADFVTIDPENRAEVIDAKSEITRKNRVYINKKKQMLACLGLEIREV